MKREETLPEGWEIRTFEDLFDIQIGGTPKRSVDEYWDKERTTRNLWVSISDMSGLENKYLCDTKEYISDLGVRKSNVKPVPEGTILVSFKLTLGRLVIAGKPLFTNEAIAALHPKTDELSRDFLFYALQKTDYYEEVDRAVKGATLNKEKLKRLKVSVPHSLEQQQKIAAILSSLDDAIEKTGAVIHQLEVVKRGLMQELFTRGVPGWHEKFVEIKRLGQVPESWSVYTLGDFAVSRQGYTFKPKYQGQKQGKWMYSKVSDMEKAGNELYILRTANYIDDDVLEEIKAKPFEAETTIFPRVGAALRTNKKRLLKVPSLVDDNIMTLVVIDKEKCLPKYLYRWMESINLEMFCNDGPLPSINSKNLLRTQIALPSLEEQKQIVHTFYVIDERIKAEQTKKGQLETIKKGLMQGLLSGRMGVKGG